MCIFVCLLDCLFYILKKEIHKVMFFSRRRRRGRIRVILRSMYIH